MMNSTLTIMNRDMNDPSQLKSQFTVIIDDTVISHSILIGEKQYNASRQTGNIEKLKEFIKAKLISEVAKKITLHLAKQHEEN